MHLFLFKTISIYMYSICDRDVSLICVIFVVAWHFNVEFPLPSFAVLFVGSEKRVAQSDVMYLGIEQRDVSVFLVID